jgi:hypothetical protein
LLALYAALKITVPALLIAGDRDLVLAFRGMDQVIANTVTFGFSANLRATTEPEDPEPQMMKS